MTSLVMLLVATAAPQKLGVMGFSHANVEDGVAEVAADHLAQQLVKQGLQVITVKDIAALIGLERQKQLLGCGDDSSCLAELQSALGVEAVVTGSLGRFGKRYTVNLKVMRTLDGTGLASFSSEVGSEDELPATLTRAAAELASQLQPKTQQSTSAKIGLGVGYGAAVMLLGGAGLCFGLAKSANDQLMRPPGNLIASSAFALAREGDLRQTVGFALLATGIAVALVTGVVMLALGGR